MKLIVSPSAAKIPGKTPHLVCATLERGTDIVDIRRGGKGSGSLMAYGIGKETLDAPLAIGIVHKLLRRARSEGFKTLALDFCQFKELFAIGEYESGHRLAEALFAANYDFHTYKKPPADGFPVIEQVYIEHAPAAAQQGLKEGTVVATYTNHVRDLANTSAKDMTPQIFAKAVAKLAGPKVKVKVLNAAELKKLGMGLILAVGGAATAPPCIVIAEYKGGKAGAAPIALVGKTITYDTGGLSIKTGDYMLGMQRDMTGGAAVMAAVFAAAALGLKKNVVAIAAVAENAVGPNAYRPGDVLKSMAGISVENGNSDAEGRLVLADGIYYAGTTYKPSLLIDVATLTGAAHVALGDYHSGLFTTDRALEDKFRQMGEDTANYVYPLPLRPSVHEPYIKSTVADVASTRMDGGRYGGATVAAMFLHKFAAASDVTRYVHLDIAPRMDVPKGTELSGPSLGEPVPLLVQAIREF